MGGARGAHALGWARPRLRAASLLAWLAAGLLAASLALPFLWTRHMEARVVQAEGELARLGTEPDPYLDFLLRQFAEYTLAFAADGDQDVDLLYRAWVASGLAREGYEARITTWVHGHAGAELRLSDLQLPPALVSSMLRTAAAAEDPVLERYTQLPSVHYLLLVPLPGGRVVSVAVPPRRQLARTTALARFLQPSEATKNGADYELLSIIPAPPGVTDTVAGMVNWVATSGGWRSEAPVHFPGGLMHAHLLLRTTAPPLLLARGALLTAALLAVMFLLWALARTLNDGPFELGLGPFPRSRSFRGRLTLALFGFFLIPTLRSARSRTARPRARLRAPQRRSPRARSRRRPPQPIPPRCRGWARASVPTCSSTGAACSRPQPRARCSIWGSFTLGSRARSTSPSRAVRTPRRRRSRASAARTTSSPTAAWGPPRCSRRPSRSPPARLRAGRAHSPMCCSS